MCYASVNDGMCRVNRFHNAAEEIVVGRDIVPPVSDGVQLSIDEYRTKLYEVMVVYSHLTKCCLCTWFAVISMIWYTTMLLAVIFLCTTPTVLCAAWHPSSF